MGEALGPRRSGDKRRYLRLLIPPLLIAVGLSVIFVLFGRPSAESSLDDDLCALGSPRPAGAAVLLLDLRKPMDEANPSLPGELLNDLSLGLGADTELSVFALSADPQAPRLPIDRFCKPYDNADLQVGTAKDQRNALRDCDNLPAQLSSSLRESANRFCVRREELRKRIDALARNPPRTPIMSAYLVEAIEETAIQLSEVSGPRMIYVFSDMMQHAAWYSHLDLDWTEWDFARFAEARAEQSKQMGLSPSVADLAVLIYYLPRTDLTDRLRPKHTHQAFWRSYFDGAQLTFEEQPVLPAYAAESLMDRLTSEELAALEREQIEQERAEAQKMLADVQREREALEEELRQLAEERSRANAVPRAQPERAAESRPERQSPVDQGEELDARQAQARGIAREEPAEDLVPPPEVDETPPASRVDDTTDRAQARGIAREEPAEDLVPPPEVDETPPASRVDDTTDRAQARGIAREEPAEDLATSPDVEDMPERESVGRLALATEQSAETELPPCEAILLPRFRTEGAMDVYPGRRRMNYGSATITIRYTLDETGGTIDDQIAVIPEESSAQRPRSLQLFADTTMDMVRNWVFEFDGGDEGTCSRRQERTIQIEYNYN